MIHDLPTVVRAVPATRAYLLSARPDAPVDHSPAHPDRFVGLRDAAAAALRRAARWVEPRSSATSGMIGCQSP